MAPVPALRASRPCRVGVDLAAVSDVAEAVRAHGDRYLRRVFTDHELETCRTGGSLRFESLAARFAAKEAVVKLLEPPDVRPPWHEIEVRRAPSGACTIRLHGAAARLAAAHELHGFALSMSHEAGLAVAVAVCATGPDQPVGLECR